MKSRVLPLIIGPASEPSADVFAARRRGLLAGIGDGVAILSAAPELLKSRDTEIRYRQSSDFYYLTGFLEPEAVAVISPHNSANDLTLFVRERDAAREAWVGPRLGVDGAAQATGGIAFPIADLPDKIQELLLAADRIHYQPGVSARIDDLVQRAITSARRLRPRSGKGPTATADLDPILGQMRVIKDAHEIERMRTAAVIAAAGHVAAMKNARPGVGEWEIEAAFEGTVRRLGADGAAFPSIIASGHNATTLHYVQNRRIANDGDLILVDAGAEWGMYCSDITRTFPANGRFTPRQAELYDVVLAAEQAGIGAAVAGARFNTIHEAVVRVLTQGMIDLGILQDESVDAAIEAGSFRRFYLHQTSHWLGLDVHDVGQYTTDDKAVELEPGMVLTVEPGIYIPADAEDVPADFRGVGIRIEDDVLVVEGGNEVLTREVPVGRDAVEAIMAAD